MSLDTVLKIGKAFRESTDGLKHFRYIRSCPLDNEKQNILRICLPINSDFTFDFDNIYEITDENIIGSDTIDTKLYYLTFKTSDKDNNPIKYIFSDIYFGVEKGKEKGWYKTEKKTDTKTGKVTINSFYEGNKDEKPFVNRIISKMPLATNEIHILENFRKAFLDNIEKIEQDVLKKYAAKNAYDILVNAKDAKKKLNAVFGSNDISWEEIEQDFGLINLLLEKEKGRVLLHFDFYNAGGKKFWYEYNHILDAISEQMREEMTNEISLKDGAKKFVFIKELYRNICSGDQSGDKQFPNFDNENRYKSFSFSGEDVKNLYYGINYTEKGIYLGKDLVSIILLPNGEHLSSNHYDAFLKKITTKIDKTLEDTTLEAEDIIKRDNEPTFNFLNLFDEDDTISDITRFDIIFVNKGQNTDSDLVEISNIERSFLSTVFRYIKKVKHEIYEKIDKEEKFSKNLSIIYSLQQILGRAQSSDDKGKKKVIFKPNPKYRSHIIKVLPKIYTACYTEDNIILPSFIQNVEYSIRHGDSRFAFLKYDLEFLLSIQNNQPYKSSYMKIVESKSYQIGLLLGRLAQQFAGDNTPIKSFEKNYVGNLTRRIASLGNFIALKTEIEEKLIMHDRSKYTFNDSNELAEKVKCFSGKYDKNECAFGFFDSYFSRAHKKSLIEKIETLLNNNQEYENPELVSQINLVINNFKQQ